MYEGRFHSENPFTTRGLGSQVPKSFATTFSHLYVVNGVVDFVVIHFRYRCNIAPLAPFKEDAGMKSDYNTMNPSIYIKK